MTTETPSGAGAPSSQPATPAPSPSGRKYFVVKKVRAGEVNPDSEVWMELPPVTAEEPQAACDAAAKRDDKNGEFREGAEYLAASRVGRKIPVKKIQTTWE